MICANDVSVEGQGFNSNDNAITVYWKEGKQSLTLASKQQIAQQIMASIAEKLEA
jgi:phosphopantothenoylcysteine decarboxylase/phosphopantothenate--cysteine ligase